MLKRAIKTLILPNGRQPVSIRAGLYRGIRLNINPQGHAQLVFGLYEIETSAFVRKMLRHARWMVDIGAAEGEMAILFARSGIPSIAVDPKHERDIREHAAMNGVTVGAGLEIVPMLVGSGDAANHRSLDAIITDRKGPGFIKIDVDGGELDVLLSGKRALSAKTASLLVETHSPQLEKDCLAFLSGLGYRTTIINNAWWRIFLPELRPSELNRWIAAEPV